MFGFGVTVQNETRKVEKKVKQASFRNLAHASGYVAKVAKRSIRKRKKPSRPGTPPHTRAGKLRNLIRYDVNQQRQESVIGPPPGFATAGTVWHLHEHGGVSLPTWKVLKHQDFQVGQFAVIQTSSGRVVKIRLRSARQAERARQFIANENARRLIDNKRVRKYPKRRFMGPAVEKSRDRIPEFWRDSVR